MISQSKAKYLIQVFTCSHNNNNKKVCEMFTMCAGGLVDLCVVTSCAVHLVDVCFGGLGLISGHSGI